MSASTERKMRQAAREAGTDKKTLALEKAAKEQAKSKRRWTIGTVAVVLAVALVLLLNSSLMNKLPAFSVGDKTFNTAEVSYRYAAQYFNFANQYGQYASLFGLDTSNGIKGLANQPCNMNDGTWKDYFMDAAKEEMVQTTVLNKYAAEKGITLDEEELAQIESAFDGVEEQAKSNGWANANRMIAANYGDGVNLSLVRQAYRDGSLANKALQALTDSFTYDEQARETMYQSLANEEDYFDYVYCYVAAEMVETTDDAGETSSKPTEETLAAAKAIADQIAETYAKAKGDSPAARLNNAAATEGQTAVPQTHVKGSSIFTAAEWLCDAARQPGDMTVEEDASGVYVVVFISRDDNHYHTVNVRHILIKAEADEDGNYSDEAKAAAKARAEEILAEYESGEKTEERFAALAEQYSEDTGSNTKGGLYENVARDQMVQEFNDFCFAPHESGDTGIVYGESGSYAGYHVMYYVGEGMLYSDSIAENELRNADVSAWLEEAKAANPTKESFGMKFVG